MDKSIILNTTEEVRFCPYCDTYTRHDVEEIDVEGDSSYIKEFTRCLNCGRC